MKYIPRPNTSLPPEAPKQPDPLISDISVDNLIGDGLLALYREIKQLLMLSARGKLDRAHSQDLRDHLKLLFEIKDRENDLLKHLSEEDLAKLLEQVKINGGE